MEIYLTHESQEVVSIYISGHRQGKAYIDVIEGQAYR
jgi:hypothetical protein